MDSLAPRHRDRRNTLRPTSSITRFLTTAAAVVLAGCAQSPPAADPVPAVQQPVSTRPAAVSIQDAEGMPIPESDPVPAAPAVSVPVTDNGPGQFICTPAGTAKPIVPPKPKPKKPRKVTRRSAEPPAASPTTTTAPPPGSKLDNVRAIEPNEVMSLLGKKVWGPTGDDMGRIVDLLVEPSGQIRAAVIDFGGFLGVGNRKIAVNWNLLKLHAGAEGKQVVLTLDRDQVLAAPEYKDPAHPAEVVAPAAKAGG